MQSHTNPGLARASTLIQNLESKLEVADPGDAQKVLKELWQDPYLKIAPRLPEKVWLPAGPGSPQWHRGKGLRCRA